METEVQFFRSLKIVVLNLIKHAEPVPAELLQPARAYDDGEWQGLPPSAKAKQIQRVQEFLGGDNPVSKHYSDYPHAFSRNCFKRMLEDLASYRDDLSRP